MARSKEQTQQLRSLFEKKFRPPSLKTKLSWHTEYIESGAQFRMSYQQFQKQKLHEYYGKKHQQRLEQAKKLRQQH